MSDTKIHRAILHTRLTLLAFLAARIAWRMFL